MARKSALCGVLAFGLAAGLLLTGCPTPTNNPDRNEEEKEKSKNTSTALTENVWTEGSLTENQINEYTISVTSGTIYFIWWNDSRQGDSTKTGDIKVSARHSNGDSLFTNVDSAWNNAQYFTATSDGTVTLSVRIDSSWNIGTYEIVYRTTNTRP